MEISSFERSIREAKLQACGELEELTLDELLEELINDFKKEGYSNDFLLDLKAGLKKSSIYENDSSNQPL